MSKLKVYCLGKLGITFQKWDRSSDDHYRYYKKFKYFVVRKSLKTLKERFKTLLFVKEHSIRTKQYERNSYNHGLVNGILYAVCILEGKKKEDMNLIEIKQELKVHKSKIIKPKGVF